MVTVNRSVVKCFIWGLIDTFCITWLLSFLFFGACEATKFTISVFLAHLVLLFLYERAWQLIPWGKDTPH